MRRRRFDGGVTLVLVFLAASASGQIPDSPHTIRLDEITTGLAGPVGTGTLQLVPTDLVPLRDGSGRMLVSTLGGPIRQRATCQTRLRERTAATASRTATPS